MHCIEIKASNFREFKQRVLSTGAKVSVLSKYQYKGVKLLDVEVSEDNKVINRLEGVFAFHE